MGILNGLFKPKPWQALEKSFKLELQCEECGVKTNALYTIQDLLCCEECKQAKNNRARLLQAEKEWAEYDNETE